MVASSLERLSEQKPGAVELRLASPRRDAEHVGDLFVLVAFHVVQDEHLARTRRQLRDRRLEVHPVPRRRAEAGGEGVDAIALLVVATEPRLVAPGALAVVQD